MTTAPTGTSSRSAASLAWASAASIPARSAGSRTSRFRCARRHTLDLEIYNASDILARQRPEDDHVVHAVQELGLERLPQQLQHLGLDLFPILRAHLEDVLRADVRRHDKHGVPEVHRATL